MHAAMARRRGPFEAHRQVDGAHVLGDAAHGHIVDAGLRDLANGLERHAARGLELERTRRPAVEEHRIGHGRQREIIEHRDVRACRDGLLQLIEVLDLDLDGNPPAVRFGGCHRLGDRAGGHDVIFLDENSIEQADAVILSPADAHRVLLCRAQPGNGLARVEHTAARALEALRVGVCRGGSAREQLQKIERGALAGQ